MAVNFINVKNLLPFRWVCDWQEGKGGKRAKMPSRRKLWPSPLSRLSQLVVVRGKKDIKLHWVLLQGRSWARMGSWSVSSGRVECWGLCTVQTSLKDNNYNDHDYGIQQNYHYWCVMVISWCMNITALMMERIRISDLYNLTSST